MDLVIRIKLSLDLHKLLDRLCYTSSKIVESPAADNIFSRKNSSVQSRRGQFTSVL